MLSENLVCWGLFFTSRPLQASLPAELLLMPHGFITHAIHLDEASTSSAYFARQWNTTEIWS